MGGLFLDKVKEWMKDVLKNYTSQEQEDVQEEEEPAPGSASAEPNIPQTFYAAAKEEEEEERTLKRPAEVIETLMGVDEGGMERGGS